MALSIRIRFEVFKRDDFTCRYCGRKSPDVVLEVDHIVPKAKRGKDDMMNLLTSCWDCNRGKSDKPLSAIITGEDPHDKAIMLLERERQLNEYNAILAREHDRREQDGWDLVAYWRSEQGYEDTASIARADWRWLFGALKYCPKEVIRGFMDTAMRNNMVRNMRYVAACVRNWRYAQAGAKPDSDESGYY